MEVNIDALTFQERGLIPAIIQDVYSGKVLMLGYMNEQSLAKTIETKTTWFYSRSRKTLWNKGETSGNVQYVKQIQYDCDGDALLIQVEQVGVACHLGERSCFFRDLYMDETDGNRFTIIEDVYQLIKNRKEQPKESSYTNYLFREGLDKILKKVGEEASEVIIGAKNENKEELIYELSDLIYHALVLMVQQGVTIEDIKKELSKRYGKKEDGRGREKR
ncbi:bifunctional phosphoribosyl-AMP cyclohydrolase/phosphoribosyl-ATP diphosphatase HisIE [Fervidibacillus albus]|uniref:Histidine biosynthesis bifunctional protein HisIE n=1 Tax=Fervidibacillus albus TaxID=2980026 RepID=A0A9E8LY94_9BACI|nr:bifunctional phosphoribosyl-AMP cyclohydrolase/phosphoribosyl-ATP diphosphatase HisIE [Fervidibacillus albus]WAA10974.1 bifunctional phosphoribosyl-AMP cyclohydrolase/phosphoribosyl-ATP diphosphatase HisIE [Fervidibacillus albus]